MWLRNNSKREWLGYNCGDEIFVDIYAHTDFEVPDKAGILILKNLGCSSWIQQIPDPIKKPEPEPEHKIIHNPVKKIGGEKTEEPGLVDRLFKKRFCKQCDSKGVRHKKECPTNYQSESEVDPAGEQEEPVINRLGL